MNFGVKHLNKNIGSLPNSKIELYRIIFYTLHTNEIFSTKSKVFLKLNELDYF